MNKTKILTDTQIKERYERCLKEKLCFISLEPLDFANDGTHITFVLDNITPIVHKKYLPTYYKKV